MADQESSVAASSSLTPNNWWDLHPPTSLSSSWHPDDRISIAPSSFTSALDRSTDASHDRLMGEDLSDNLIWRHVFSSVGDKYGSSMHNNDQDNMLEPACNYLKQLETWEFTHSPSFNNVGQSNHFTNNSELFTNNNFKVENECHEMEQVLGYHYGMHNNSPRNSSDSMSFSRNRLGKPLIDDNIRATTRSLKSMTLFDGCKKQAQQTSSPTGMDRGDTVHQGKKKRISEDNSETILKKTKQESSLMTNKVPKVKLAEKISALQQIVSPFGKTDTASVLYEAIGYINFLQEQIQMLSNPYMKTASHKCEMMSRSVKLTKENTKRILRAWQRNKAVCFFSRKYIVNLQKMT